jgi:hypothetical protein
MQVLSNDILKAPLHRVRSPHNKGRYSAPFFFNPRADAVIAPLPSFITADRLAVYKPIPWRKFREQRFAGERLCGRCATGALLQIFLDSGSTANSSDCRIDRLQGITTLLLLCR